MCKIALFSLTVIFFTLVECNDIRFGYVSPHSRKIYSEIKEADPALWRRTDDVIINADGNKLIDAVFVTDLRDDKAGEAVVEGGGVGGKSVTVGLKSPSVLRGYKFLVEVYGSEPTERYFSKGSQYNEDTQFARKF